MDKTQEGPGLKRALQARHLSMIAIGGSIGTGLFLASGATVAAAGAGGALLAYVLIGVMVYFLMTSLGEMAAFMPESGSFQVYGSRFVDPAFGFAQGWNYWYNWAITVAVELAAAAIIMHYWFPEIPGIYWSAGFLVIIFVLNYFSVRGFGEAEFWCSMLKVVTIVAFIVLGCIMIFRILMGWDGAQAVLPGWEAIQANGSPFYGGFAAFIGVAMIVGFSFQGTELIGVAAGESEDPGNNIPRAVRQIFWRILMFYMLSIFIVGLLISFKDPLLLRNEATDVGASPFTLVFSRVGLAMSASLMNAVILSAILSAGNSGMYASTRMLYTLAKNKMAPALFKRVSANGVPRNALYATTIIAALCFLTSLFKANAVYLWLVNSSGMTGFIAWLGVAISHYRFRRAYVKQGYDLKALPYRAKWFPFGPLFAFFLCLCIMLGQNYEAFTRDSIDWQGVIAAYIGIPLFLVLWFGYKWKNKTKLVPLEKIEIKGHFHKDA